MPYPVRDEALWLWLSIFYMRQWLRTLGIETSDGARQS